VGDRAVERAEILVGERGGLLDARERADVVRLEPLARDREILDGALRLRTVERVGGNANLAHRVVFYVEFSHFVVLSGQAAAESSATPRVTLGTAAPSASR